MRLLNDSSYYAESGTDGDLAPWGIEQPQVLPPLVVSAPNPFALKPHVINTTTYLPSDAPLPMVDLPSVAPKTPWLLYAVLAVGAYLFVTGGRRGGRLDW